MAAEDPHGTTGPSLEPPKLFRRRRKDAAEASPEPAEAVASPPVGDTRVHDDAPRFTDSGVGAGSDSGDRAEDVAARRDPAVAPATSTGRTLRVPQLSGLSRLPRVPRGSRGVPARIGAPLAGLVTGGALLALMWLGFRGCEALRGTTSCGTGPGMLALVVVFALTVVVGVILLSLLQLPDPGMTSFLAVGITSLVAVLLLDGLFDSAAILVVIPLLSAAAFAASWWISTLQVDLDD